MPKYNLVGVDGNAYSIMGYVSYAMRKEHYSREEIDAYLRDAMLSDYNNLLAVSADMVEKLNSKYQTQTEEDEEDE